MQRRTFVAGLGSAAAAGTAAVGTGAFSSTTADRTVTVEVATDSTAYLSLAPADGSNGEYATLDGGELAVDMTASNPTGGGGTGVNADATTRVDGVFVVENHGTQAVDVELDSYYLQDGGDFVVVYPESEASELPAGSGGGPLAGGGIDPVTLSPGDDEPFGLFASVYLGADALGGTVTVTAKATG